MGRSQVLSLENNLPETGDANCRLAHLTPHNQDCKMNPDLPNSNTESYVPISWACNHNRAMMCQSVPKHIIHVALKGQLHLVLNNLTAIFCEIRYGQRIQGEI